MVNFYNELSSDGVLFFWIIAVLIVLLVILLIVLFLKNKKLNKLINNMHSDKTENDTEDIIINNIPYTPGFISRESSSFFFLFLFAIISLQSTIWL